MAKYSIKKYSTDSGERVAMLVDDTGTPHFYANLFITTQIRNASLSTDTAAHYLNAIKVLLSWEAANSLDIQRMFKERNLLSDVHLDSIRDFSQVSRSNTNQNIVHFKSDFKAVSKQTHYSILTGISKYLSFLSHLLINTNNDQSHDDVIQRMVKGLEHRRPRGISRNIRIAPDRAVEQQTLNLIRTVVQPGHPDNPYGLNVQVRNCLIVEMLIALGLRRGELCALQTTDIDFRQNVLSVVRRHDDPADPRNDQPKAKTAERNIPIHEDLVALIHDYINHYRSQYRAAKSHGYLFVSTKGKSAGMPLSLISVNKMFDSLKKISGDNELSPHRLRHQWNYQFSRMIDSNAERISVEREDAIRCYLMGWSSTSNMASIYNKRRIKEEAHEALKRQQERLRSKDE